jgi:hypothetical protein
MSNAGVYLKHNIVAEPLFNQWHADRLMVGKFLRLTLWA